MVIVHFAFLTLFHYFIIKQSLQNTILHMFGPSGVLPMVLPFTQFYPPTLIWAQPKTFSPIHKFLSTTVPQRTPFNIKILTISPCTALVCKNFNNFPCSALVCPKFLNIPALCPPCKKPETRQVLFRTQGYDIFKYMIIMVTLCAILLQKSVLK